MRTCDRPAWPQEALRKEQTGKVILGFLIGDDGKVIDAVVRSSSGVPLLDEAALSSMKRCQFRPLQIKGVNISSWTQMQYIWVLDTPKNAERSMKDFEAYRTAALAGDTAAILKLSHVFRDGAGIERDHAHYALLLRSIAERGYAEAEAELANNLRYGQYGIAKNPAQSLAWSQRAAEHGHAQSQFNMGELLYTSADASAADLVSAASWYRKAAEQGYNVAQYKMGVITEAGRGVEQSITDAASWYRKAAESGHMVASAKLGKLYLQGLGVERDPVQATAWLTKAAQQRQPSAEAALANLYFSGEGVPQNDAEGVKYLRRAAIASNIAAMRQLGQMLEQGSHIAADPKEAAIWLDKVARLDGAISAADAAEIGDW